MLECHRVQDHRLAANYLGKCRGVYSADITIAGALRQASGWACFTARCVKLALDRAFPVAFDNCV